jgi:hypothetical protein
MTASAPSMSFAPVPQCTSGTAPQRSWRLRSAGPGVEVRIEEGLRQRRLRGRRKTFPTRSTGEALRGVGNGRRP